MALSNGSKYLTRPSEIPVKASGSNTERTLGDWVEGQVFSYATLQDALADDGLNVGDYIQTAGYYEALDGGGNKYLCVATGTGAGDGGRFIDHPSSPVQLKGVFHGGIFAEQFGATLGLSGDNSQAINSALLYAESSGVSVCNVPSQWYMCESSIRVPNGVTLQGSGVGEWDTIFINRPKGWSGTNLVFKGTGDKTEGFRGVTNQSNTGGVTSDFSLTNYMNEDASGSSSATPRLFSAAVSPLERANDSTEVHPQYVGVSNLRIVPWIGSDGYSDYSDKTNTDIGDDWDVGLYMPDSEHEHISNVQVVGYWRITGTLRVQPGYDEYASGERGIYKDFKTQGLHLRATDVYEAISSSSAEVTIPWTTSSYWDASGMFEVVGLGNFSYTGVTQSGDQMTFTGVTPDASGVATRVIRSIRRGSGVAGTEFRNVIVNGYNHHSGSAASTLGLGEKFAFEVSGFPLRGMSFWNFKVQNTDAEPKNSLYANLDDSFWFGCQHEVGEVVALPFKSDQTGVDYPVMTTLDMRLYGHVWSGVDKSLFNPRFYFDDTETINPVNGFYNQDMTLSQEGRDKVIRKASGQKFTIQDYDGTALLDFSSSGNITIPNGKQLSFSGGPAYINAASGQAMYLREGFNIRWQTFATSGTFAPGADNDQSIGNNSLRVEDIFLVNSPTVTSDERLKTPIQSLSESEKAVASEVKAAIGKYKWLSSIEKKGDNARWHFGIGAQTIIDIFSEHGLDAFDYGCIGYDEWEGQEAVVGEDGLLQRTEIEEGDRYSVRPNELLFFIMTAL